MHATTLDAGSPLAIVRETFASRAAHTRTAANALHAADSMDARATYFSGRAWALAHVVRLLDASEGTAPRAIVAVVQALGTHALAESQRTPDDYRQAEHDGARNAYRECERLLREVFAV